MTPNLCGIMDAPTLLLDVDGLDVHLTSLHDFLHCWAAGVVWRRWMVREKGRD